MSASRVETVHVTSTTTDPSCDLLRIISVDTVADDIYLIRVTLA